MAYSKRICGDPVNRTAVDCGTRAGEGFHPDCHIMQNHTKFTTFTEVRG
jgi:hypothetical protein